MAPIIQKLYITKIMSRAAANVSKSRLIVRFRCLFLLTTILAGGSFILTTNKGINLILIDNDSESASSWESNRYDIVNSEERFTISTEGCSISALKPLDDSIIHLVEYPTELKSCPNSSNALLGNSRKKIWIRYENIQYYNITDELLCCYHAFHRPALVEDIGSYYIDDRVKYDFCIKFNDSIEVRNEFVKVACFAENNKKVYERYFLFAPKKNFITHENKGEIPLTKNGYNVLVLGIDAVSRLNFHRTMPKTAGYLKEKGAVEFLGYNKVGDNTFPNLIPMLLGLKESELKNTCWTHKEATFDNCPFIWEWFKQAGYFTAFGEDSASLGMFNYLRAGFINTPTDYYIHTFIHEAEKHVGTVKDFNSYLCMNEKYFYKVLLDYVQDMTWTLKYKRLFGFFWEITMSHDYLNYPMKMDDDYLMFFRKLETTKYLNNTIVVFVSDHGIRWGDIRSTKQGRLEERLPFLYILTPPSFRENYTEAYNNLKLNSKRLSTPFDVHATLSDLVNLENLKNDVITSRSNEKYAYSRAISLFLPIPSNRTCQIAGIDDHWCTCLKDIPLRKNTPKAVKAAASLVELLNSLMTDYPQCANLSLSEVLDVTQVEVGKPDENELSWKEFLVVVKTAPGGGIFEATLRQNEGDNSWTLAGTASRLNLYGEQSRCVNQSQLKLYCYCS